MPKQKLKDNSTFTHKKVLRERAITMLAEYGVDDPVILEAYGGEGKLYRACYRAFRQGVVMEKDAKKIAVLARQRPTWAVYECDCVQALSDGLGGHLAVNLLDVDPYGDSHPTLEAFFSSQRPFADVLAVVVNDGLRQSLGLGTAWNVKSMRRMVEKYGNDLHPIYLEISEELLRDYVAPVGYRVETFAGYYCGPSQFNTHWLALLRRG